MAVNKIPESQLPVRSVSDTDYVRIVGADGKSYRVPKTDFNGGGGGGTVDPSLSPTSTNPVQNKAIYSALSGLNDDLGDLSELDTTVKTDLVSAINEVAQGGGTTELFEATYGTTTNAQIEAALNANKLVYCVYDNRVYLLTSRQSTTQHRFTTITHVFILHALVCNNNSWSKVSLTPQSTSNLVTSVSSASTDSEYPSAKLFYDTIGDVETLLAAI